MKSPSTVEWKKVLKGEQAYLGDYGIADPVSGRLRQSRRMSGEIKTNGVIDMAEQQQIERPAWAKDFDQKKIKKQVEAGEIPTKIELPKVENESLTLTFAAEPFPVENAKLVDGKATYAKVKTATGIEGQALLPEGFLEKLFVMCEQKNLNPNALTGMTVSIWRESYEHKKFGNVLGWRVVIPDETSETSE